MTPTPTPTPTHTQAQIDAEIAAPTPTHLAFVWAVTTSEPAEPDRIDLFRSRLGALQACLAEDLLLAEEEPDLDPLWTSTTVDELGHVVWRDQASALTRTLTQVELGA